MTQLTATLAIPSENIDLMQAMFEEMKQLRAALREDDILTEEEAAAVLKVGLTTLRNWRREGWLPFFSEGKLIKHERKALLRAYKIRFGKVTHYEKLQDIESGSKRRIS